MKKILNSPANYVDEMLAGLVAAHPEYYRLHGDSGKVVARANAGAKGKVMVKCPPDKFKVTPYLYGPCSMVRYLLPCVNVCVYACNTCVV